MTTAKRVVVLGADPSPWAESLASSKASAEVSLVRLVEDFPDFLARRGRWEGVAAPAFILLDFGADHSGAVRAIRSMKGREDLRSVPIVASTGSAIIAVEPLYEAGASSVVVLPEDPARAAEIVSFVSRYWLESVELPS